MLTYKALNTFIDDLFAFVIKMPMMYRIGCLRDGMSFLSEICFMNLLESGEGWWEEKVFVDFLCPRFKMSHFKFVA